MKKTATRDSGARETSAPASPRTQASRAQQSTASRKLAMQPPAPTTAAQGASAVAPPTLDLSHLHLSFYLGSDPLAPYTVLREESPTGFALLARTARSKTADGATASSEHEPEFVETWVPLASLVRPRIAFTGIGDLRTRLWPLVSDPYPDQRAVVPVIQDEIVNRWAERNASLLGREVHVRLLRPEDVDVAGTLVWTDLSSPPPPASVLAFDLDGIPLETSDGSLNPVMLDLLGTNDIETIIAEVGEAARIIGMAGDLLRATDAVLDQEEAFWSLVESNPDGVSRNEEAAHFGLFSIQLTEGSDAASLSIDMPKGGGIIQAPLWMIQQTFLSDHPDYAEQLAPGQARLADLMQRAMLAHKEFENSFAARELQLKEEVSPITAASVEEVWNRAGREWDEGDHFVSVMDYLGWAAGKGVHGATSSFTGSYADTEEGLAKAYSAGQISFDELRHVEDAAAGRGAIVGFVMIGLTLATAGLAAGVPALTATLGRAMLFSGAASGVTTMTGMTTSTLVTGATHFDNPAMQAAWARGAHSPGEIAVSGLFSFGLGAAAPAAGVAFGKLFTFLRAAPAEAVAATALVKTEGAAALGEFAAPQGWIAEEAAPGVVRFTHPEFPGQVLSNGRTLRVQIEAGTGVLEREIPLTGGSPPSPTLLLPGAAEEGGGSLATTAAGESTAPAVSDAPGALTAPEPPLALPAGKSPAAVAPRASRRIAVPSPKPAVAPPPPNVWVNPGTDVYHLPGSRYYMKTTVGRLMPRAEAERLGYRLAGTPRAQVLATKVARARAKLAAGEGSRSANLERVSIAESQLAWHGIDTPSQFARHQQSFSSLADIMDSKAAQLAANGQASLLPVVDRQVLRIPVDEFARTRLGPAWNALSAADRAKFLGELGGREVGARVPDIVEFFLTKRRINVLDITEDVLGPLHRFKSDFYQAVMQEMCGPNGPAVLTQDINPERPLIGSAPR